MKKMKQIAAIIAIILLLGLYVWSFIAALLARPESNQVFWAAVFCTIFVPIILFLFIRMNEYRKEGTTMADIRRQKKQMKAAEKAKNKNKKED